MPPEIKDMFLHYIQSTENDIWIALGIGIVALVFWWIYQRL